MTRSMVTWISGGFRNPDGSKTPAFIQNPGRFLKQSTDRAIGAYILDTVPQLCTPFGRNIGIALELNYRGSRIRPERRVCTLSRVFDELETTYEEFQADFTRGGWDAWITLATRPQNNIHFSDNFRLKFSITQSGRFINDSPARTLNTCAPCFVIKPYETLSF